MASYYPASDPTRPTPAGRAQPAKKPSVRSSTRLRVLVPDDVPGLRNDPQLERVCPRRSLANGSGRNHRVPLPDEQQRGAQRWRAATGVWSTPRPDR